jgi:DNA repair protein RecO (recombination protein O)
LTEDHETSPEIYELLSACLTLMEKSDDILKVLAVFMVRLVTLAGWKLQLDFCAHCHGTLAPDRQGRLPVSGRWGGPLCRNCLEYDTRARTASAGAVRQLRYLQRVHLEQIDRLKLRPAEKTELVGLLRYLIETQADHDFRSVAFLDHLGSLARPR